MGGKDPRQEETMAIERHASAVWEGSLTEGSGRFGLRSSGLVKDAPISWPARTEEPGGMTSPEELLAAAHASCYAMAFAAHLGRTAGPPERLEVDCTVTFERKPEGGFRVATSTLRVRGRVPGMDAAAFQEAARAGEQGCPISNALRGNVEIRVEASLLS
jgi:osmotically inducible protein OsmC